MTAALMGKKGRFQVRGLTPQRYAWVLKEEAPEHSGLLGSPEDKELQMNY